MSLAQSPEPGEPDYDWGPRLFVFVICTSIFPTIAVALRFWSRTVVLNMNESRRYWWDDWTALAALPFLIIMNVFVTQGIYYGWGRHAWTLTPEQLEGYGFWFWTIFTPHPVGIFLSKLSAVFFYARIFSSVNRKFTIALWATGSFIVASLLISVLCSYVMCRPLAKNWDPTVPGVCGQEAAAYDYNMISSVVADVIVLLLPMPLVWRLQLSKSQKLFVTGIFVLGYGIAIISIGRLIAFYSHPLSYFEADPTGAAEAVEFWTFAETPMALVCVCLPSIYQLARRGIQLGPRALFHASRGSHTPASFSAGGNDFSQRRRSTIRNASALNDVERGQSLDRIVTDDSDQWKSFYPMYEGPQDPSNHAVHFDQSSKEQWV